VTPLRINILIGMGKGGTKDNKSHNKMRSKGGGVIMIIKSNAGGSSK
jgi:hypothetical protein